MGHSALVDDPIDVAAVSGAVEGPDCGAVVVFAGAVRATFRGRGVLAITYDGYRAMAERVLARLVAEQEAAHPGLRAAVVHRLGYLEPGQVSVAIAVASPHRGLAYDASRELLERLKREVPIWKHEHYEDGTSTWREEEALR